MASCREELGDACGFETSFGETEGGSQTGTTSADDDGVVLVIDDCVVADG